jgi:hypothetical protein
MPAEFDTFVTITEMFSGGFFSNCKIGLVEFLIESLSEISGAAEIWFVEAKAAVGRATSDNIMNKKVRQMLAIE